MLYDPIEKYLRILPPHKKALQRIGIKTVRDLLYYFPSRYGDSAEVTKISEAKEGTVVALYGTLTKLKTKKAFYKKIPMAEGILNDESGSIHLVWFHQAYMAKMIPEGAFVRVEGKITNKKGTLSISNPKVEQLAKIPIAVGNSLFGTDEPLSILYPVYPETKGVTSNWIYHAIEKIFKTGILETLDDPIPSAILEKYHLPPLKTALVWIHSPKKQSDAIAARKRFAFEEIFFIQIERQRDRELWKEHNAYQITIDQEKIEDFISRLPFKPTEAQKKSVHTILNDFSKTHPMSRLLEGDVGSGKTAVAATAAYAIVSTQPKEQSFGNLQVAYMAPTEILAEQHFESFIENFKHAGISVGLITGSGCKKFPSKINPEGSTTISRAQLLKWVANGEIPILIGTHSLIQKTVKFKHLAFVIIDEQHRFGTQQRKTLREKEGRIPHLLSMTATPIPRTLALTLYGDLDLSLLDQMPQGRKKIITKVYEPHKRNEVYGAIRSELEKGRQLYIICPRINEPDPNKEGAILAKSVKEEARRLKKDIFPNYEIGILHSKMTTAEKEKVMRSFKDGALHILVATSVVEVGVNVPNATMIIIEGAERFGLAQLHQLRGRVIRSNHQPYCFVFAETKSTKSIERLRALTKAENGFELAEYDLQQRGAGELYGKKQWGLSDLAMDAIKNIKMVEAAREEALLIVTQDTELENVPLIKKYLDSHHESIHFE